MRGILFISLVLALSSSAVTAFGFFRGSGEADEQKVLGVSDARADHAVSEGAGGEKLCNMCKTAINPFLVNPVATSLQKSCDSFASSSSDFTQCRMSWVTRYNTLRNFRTNGCTNDSGVRVIPCTDAEVICSAFAIYPGPGQPRVKDTYCDPVAGFAKPFAGALPIPV